MQIIKAGGTGGGGGGAAWTSAAGAFAPNAAMAAGDYLYLLGQETSALNNVAVRIDNANSMTGLDRAYLGIYSAGVMTGMYQSGSAFGGDLENFFLLSSYNGSGGMAPNVARSRTFGIATQGDGGGINFGCIGFGLGLQNYSSNAECFMHFDNSGKGIAAFNSSLSVWHSQRLCFDNTSYQVGDSYLYKSAGTGGNVSYFYDSTEVTRDDGTNFKFVGRINGNFSAVGDTHPYAAFGIWGGVPQVAVGPGAASAPVGGLTYTAIPAQLKVTDGAGGHGSFLRLVTPWVALTSAASVAVNAALGNQFTLTLAGNVTLANPTNPYDGQKITFRIKQSVGGGNTVAFDTKYRFGTDITAYTMTATADKVDYVTVLYNLTADLWDIVAIVKGY